MLCCLPFLLMAGQRQDDSNPAAVGNDWFPIKEANYEEDTVI